LVLSSQNPSGQRQNRTADPLFFRYGQTLWPSVSL